MTPTNCKKHTDRKVHVIVISGDGACEECYLETRIRYNRKVLENIDIEVFNLNQEHAHLEGELERVRARYAATS